MASTGWPDSEVEEVLFWPRPHPLPGSRDCGSEVQPDPEKVQAVRNYPEPITKTRFRSFLGLAGYYWCNNRDFLTVATPLTQLTMKDRPDKVIFDQTCCGLCVCYVQCWYN